MHQNAQFQNALIYDKTTNSNDKSNAAINTNLIIIISHDNNVRSHSKTQLETNCTKILFNTLHTSVSGWAIIGAVHVKNVLYQP